MKDGRYRVLTRLRPLLIEVYDSLDDVDRLLAEVGIDPTLVRRSDTVANYWGAALMEAHKRDKVGLLVEIAQREYGERSSEFAAAYDYYQQKRRRRPAAGGKGVEQPPQRPVRVFSAQADGTRERALLIMPSGPEAEVARPHITSIRNRWRGEMYVLDGNVRRMDVIDAAMQPYDWIIYVGEGGEQGWPLADGTLRLDQVVTCIQSANASCVLLSTSTGGLFGLEIHRTTAANVIFTLENIDLADSLQAIDTFLQRYAVAGMEEAVSYLRQRTQQPHIYFLPSWAFAERLNASLMAMQEEIKELQTWRAAATQGTSATQQQVLIAQWKVWFWAVLVLLVTIVILWGFYGR